MHPWNADQGRHEMHKHGNNTKKRKQLHNIIERWAIICFQSKIKNNDIEIPIETMKIKIYWSKSYNNYNGFLINYLAIDTNVDGILSPRPATSRYLKIRYSTFF